MRMLSTIEPIIRNCMKGMANYAAEDAKAVNDLKEGADTLGKGQEWATYIKQLLSAGKQYLKSEYKVTLQTFL